MSGRAEGARGPGPTVFVDVDTQVDFIEPDGALHVPGAEGLKGRLRALVAAAEAGGAPVVASADAHVAGDPELGRFPPHCMAGTPGARKIPETRPARAGVVGADGTRRGPAEGGATVVLEKVTFDLFDNPAAEAVLRDTGAERAVVFGVALDYCVRAAALGLAARGYETVVVEDATAPVTAEGGRAARAELEAAGVRFRTTAEVLAELAREARP